jgi:hypothetical protein
VPRWISVVAITALLVAIVALVVALTYHPEIAELKTLQTTVSQQNSQIQQLNFMVRQLHEKVQTPVAKENISRVEIETLWNNVNNYVKNKKPGWTEEEMAQELEQRFGPWVETKIVNASNVQYLFIKFKCCEPTQEWWWITWKGLLSSTECPVKP